MFWTGVSIGIALVALVVCIIALNKRRVARKQLKKDNHAVALQFRKDSKILLLLALVMLIGSIVMFVVSGGLVLIGL